MWKDSVYTANKFEDPETIENLLRYFCDSNEKECFADSYDVNQCYGVY